MAEYEAYILGIEEAIDMRIKHLDIYGDSALVINQIKGEWETHHANLIPYRDYARRLLTYFTKVELHLIHKILNHFASGEILLLLKNQLLKNQLLRTFSF